MNKSALRPPAILVLTGASGAGKTTLILKLNELVIPGVKGINCDRVKIEVDESALRTFGWVQIPMNILENDPDGAAIQSFSMDMESRNPNLSRWNRRWKAFYFSERLISSDGQLIAAS